MWRHEEKIENGKLVCIDVWLENGVIKKLKITGDFFLHPEERIEKIENTLMGVRVSENQEELVKRINEALGDAQLIGATPIDIVRILKKAVDK